MLHMSYRDEENSALDKVILEGGVSQKLCKILQNEKRTCQALLNTTVRHSVSQRARFWEVNFSKYRRSSRSLELMLGASSIRLHDGMTSSVLRTSSTRMPARVKQVGQATAARWSVECLSSISSQFSRDL